VLRGAAEALSVLKSRNADEQRRASLHAVALLRREVTPADWGRAGLPMPGRSGDTRPGPVPRCHRSSMVLARCAMELHCAAVPLAQRPALWARLAGLLNESAPASVSPFPGRLGERVLHARAAAGDDSAQVIDGLAAAVEWHRTVGGEDGYLTAVARANLAVAYRQRGGLNDLERSIALTAEEVQGRTARYGPAHPFTLDARFLHARSLLARAEAEPDDLARRDLARQALKDIGGVSAARDRLFGSAARHDVFSRRHEGQALLIMGEFERARACLECALVFEAGGSDNGEYRGSGPTHLLLSRVHATLGNLGDARGHALAAIRLLSRDCPGGSAHRDATSLLERLDSCHDNDRARPQIT
jgi:tetratricopeptide (TPR) repeat protein